MPRNKTLDQVTAMQAKAVRFLRDVKGDEDKAEEFEAMSPEEYADHKRVKIVENPCSRGAQITIRRITIMPKPTLAELEAQLEDALADKEDLQAENDALNDKLDLIAGITSDEDEDEDDEDVNGAEDDDDLD